MMGQVIVSSKIENKHYFCNPLLTFYQVTSRVQRLFNQIKEYCTKVNIVIGKNNGHVNCEYFLPYTWVVL